MSEQEKEQCPCCGYKTLDADNLRHYDICLVCFWEDDPIQFDDPEYRGGANIVSLTEARKNFKDFGASEKCFISDVQKPTKDENQ